MNRDDVTFTGGSRVVAVSLITAVVGLVALVIGGVVSPRRFLFAYLAAYNFVLTTALGALILLMTCHAMRATWPVVMRRLIEALTSTLPLLAVLFLPILVGVGVLYPWVQPASIADDHDRSLVLAKAPYLNVPFFAVRAVLFFAVWIVTASLLNRWSARQDTAPDAPVEHRMYAFSGGMLPAVALTVAFASFDWLMSLTPTWFSTMYPVYYFAGGFVTAIACVTVLAWAAQRTGWIEGLNESHFYALGRLLLAFVIFWAYAAFFQLLLIWIANEPAEVTFYLARSRGGFRVESVVLVVAQFVLPFIVLLNYDIKRRPGPLALVAGWLIAAHYIDVHWLVIPAAPPGPVFGYVDLGAVLALSGVTVAFATLRLRGRRLVPINDSRLAQARRYDSA